MELLCDGAGLTRGLRETGWQVTVVKGGGERRGERGEGGENGGTVHLGKASSASTCQRRKSKEG